jgi:hypothetical protein
MFPAGRMIDGTDQLSVHIIVKQVSIGMSHEVPAELIDLLGMAGRAIPGAHHHMDTVSVMFKGIFVGFGPKAMTFGAPHGNRLQIRGHGLA